MEIIWLELVNFESVNVGKMVLKITKDGVVATRSGIAGTTTTVSRKPLPGEDVLVRRLAEATSQAIDKGLAKQVTSL